MSALFALQSVPYGDSRRLACVPNACQDPGILQATADRALKKVSELFFDCLYAVDVPSCLCAYVAHVS